MSGGAIGMASGVGVFLRFLINFAAHSSLLL